MPRANAALRLKERHEPAAEWEAYCQGSHNYRHTPKSVDVPNDVKLAPAEPAGTWDPFMAGAR